MTIIVGPRANWEWINIDGDVWIELKVDIEKDIESWEESETQTET
jgi:hypothetical protein